MNFVPADHATTVSNVGLLNTAKMIARAGFNYHRTMAYYVSKRQFARLNNFLYTKTLVPTGEGSGELAYYFIGKLLQRHPELVPFPKYVEIEVTTKCGKRCIMCEHTWWHEPNVDLSLANFTKLTDQFDLKWVNLTGEGDAFLNPHYLDMIAHLKHRNTSVYLVDSFDLINSDTSFKLVQMGVDGIYISMDGATATTYESIKKGNNFDKVLHNIKTLLNYKRHMHSPVPEICFRYVVNSRNQHEMLDFVKLINSVALRREWGDGSKIHFAGILDFPEIHDLYIDKLPTDQMTGITNYMTTNPDYVPSVFAHTDEMLNPNINRCLAWAEPYFALVPHPMMLPCCAVLMSNSRARLEEYCFGDYTKESVRDMWNSNYYRWFRSTVTNPTAKVPAFCAGCRAYDTKERMQKYGVDSRRRRDFE